MRSEPNQADPRSRANPYEKKQAMPSTIDKYLKSSMSKDDILAKLKQDLFRKDQPAEEEKPRVEQPPPPRQKAPPGRLFGNDNEVVLSLFCLCKKLDLATTASTSTSSNLWSVFGAGFELTGPFTA